MLSLKKLVVVLHQESINDIEPLKNILFETKAELSAYNTPDGLLIVDEHSGKTGRKRNSRTIAVFKEWLFWREMK